MLFQSAHKCVFSFLASYEACDVQSNALVLIIGPVGSEVACHLVAYFLGAKPCASN